MAAQQPRVSLVNDEKTVACALDVNDPALGDNVKEVVRNANTRWLKNEEVLTLLESFQLDNVAWPKEASEKPDGTHLCNFFLMFFSSASSLPPPPYPPRYYALPGGRLFVFNRKICRAFRSDKHNWRKKNGT